MIVKFDNGFCIEGIPLITRFKTTNQRGSRLIPLEY